MTIDHNIRTENGSNTKLKLKTMNILQVNTYYLLIKVEY